jgi:predicted regulator of Ras-like GTPase activity (Roadblock/LC7/MglB family)
MNTEQLTTTERKIERFSQILGQKPGDELTVLAMAEASFRRGLKLDALTAYQEVTKEKPVPEAHLAVAEIYSQQNMINEAYIELSKLFEVDPENVEARLLAHTLEDILPLPDEIQEVLNVPTTDQAFEEANLRLRIQLTIHNRELQERTRNVTLEPGVVIHEYYVEEAKKKLMDIQEQLRQMVQLKAHNEALKLAPPPRPEPVAPQAEAEEGQEVEPLVTTGEFGDSTVEEVVADQPGMAVDAQDGVSGVLSATVSQAGEVVDSAPDSQAMEGEALKLPLESHSDSQEASVANPGELPAEVESVPQSASAESSVGFPSEDSSEYSPTDGQTQIDLQASPAEDSTDSEFQTASLDWEQGAVEQPETLLESPQHQIGAQGATAQQETGYPSGADTQDADPVQSGIELGQPAVQDYSAPKIDMDYRAAEYPGGAESVTELQPDSAALPPDSGIETLSSVEQAPREPEPPAPVEQQFESPVQPDFPSPDDEPQSVLEVGDSHLPPDSSPLQANAAPDARHIQTPPDAQVEPTIEPPEPDLPEPQMNEPEQPHGLPDQPFTADFAIDSVVPPELPDEPVQSHDNTIQVEDRDPIAVHTQSIEIDHEPIAVTPEPIEVTPEPIALEPDPQPMEVTPEPISVMPDPIEVAPEPIAVAPEPEPKEVIPEPIAVTPDSIEVTPEPIEAHPETVAVSHEPSVIEDVEPEVASPEVVPPAAASPGNAAERQAYYESKAEELGKLTGALARTRGVTSIFLVARDGTTIDSVVKDDVTEARVGELVKESFEFLLAYAKSPSYWVLECTGGIFVMQTLDDHHVLIAIGQAGANFGALRYTMDKTKAKFGEILDNVPL